MGEVFQNGEILAEAMLVAWREFRHDMILLENGAACSAQACGIEVAYRDNSAPVALRARIKRLEDVGKLEVPDPYTTFPMCEVLKATRILSREIGDKVWICARADQGPMGLAAQLRGMSELMMDIALDEQEGLIHQLLDYARCVCARYACALIECGGHSTSIGESLAGPDLLSPKHYRKYPWIHEKTLVSELAKNSIILHSHICGSTEGILDDFLATGARVLEVDHKTDAAKIKVAARQKSCLLGNLDTRLLSRGTPEQVDEACRELIPIWKPDAGFILGPGCAMDPLMPADNIHALVEAAKKYGSYSGRSGHANSDTDYTFVSS